MTTHNIAVPTKVGGFYTLRARNAETGEITREIGPFHNKITDLGLNRIGTGVPITHVYVGTGTAPASYSDTNMSAFKVATSTLTAGHGTRVAATLANPYCSYTSAYRFAAGAINGNITEVGIGWASTPAGALWSRELIVDGSGDPVTMTVLANEYLDVIYTLRYYIDLTDTTGSFTLNGIVYNYTLRTANLGSASVDPTNRVGPPQLLQCYGTGATLGAVTGGISGAVPQAGGTINNIAYVSGSYKQAASSDFSLGTGNISGGIMAFNLSTYAGAVSGGASYGMLNQSWQMLLDKAIPKTADNTMSIVMSRTWARA